MPGSDSVNFEVIVTCAVTGAGDTVGKHPGVPVTPEQIAQAAIDAAKAGATAAHLHVRDPATGKGSRDPEIPGQTAAARAHPPAGRGSSQKQSKHSTSLAGGAKASKAEGIRRRPRSLLEFAFGVGLRPGD